jgi:hypothetical protein
MQVYQYATPEQVDRLRAGAGFFVCCADRSHPAKVLLLLPRCNRRTGLESLSSLIAFGGNKVIHGLGRCGEGKTIMAAKVRAVL